MKNKKRTRQTRIYSEDLRELKRRFPEFGKSVSSAEFFRETLRTNIFIQMELLIRKKNKRK